MGVDQHPITGSRGRELRLDPLHVGVWAVLLIAPLAGFWLLIAAPELDAEWEHHPAHFWLVLGAAVGAASFALGTGEAARRRGDARLLLISLAFLAAAGFLGLHALATPGVLLDGPNGGFQLATPVGLLIAAGFAAASAMRLDGSRAEAVVRRAGLLRGLLLALFALWAAASLAELGPLDDPEPFGSGSPPLVTVGLAGLALFGFAAFRYLRSLGPRTPLLVAGVVSAFVLLAQAAMAAAFARNWHLTWWEWHLLMLVAFALVAGAARREWQEERYSDLYLEQTAAGEREVSVLLADLAGFTSFSERHEPREVTRMLNAYYEAMVPAVVEEEGGEVDRLIGDALLATFNTRGDQPDHPLRAARAGLRIQERAATIAERNPGWPRLRAAVNTGLVAVGVVGARAGRTFTVIGDAVNVAARLEAEAPLGGVVVGAATLARLDAARAELLSRVVMKGKRDPVEVYLLHGLDRPAGELSREAD